MTALFVFSGLPLAYTLTWRVSGIPVINGFILVSIVVVIIEYFFRRPRHQSLFALYIAGGCYMLLISVLYANNQDFTWAFATRDVLAYMGLPVGIAWARLQARGNAERLLSRWYWAACVMITITSCGLYLGYIRAFKVTERLSDGALFFSFTYITSLLPLMWVGARSGRWWQPILVSVGVVLCLWAAVLSAARSVVLIVSASLVCILVMEIKRHKRSFMWIGLAGIIVIMTYISTTESTQDLFIARRLTNTNIVKEYRAQEIQNMLSQMGTTEWVLGAGFGRRFYAPSILPGGEDHVLAPHIGFSTLLYKGGVSCFVILLLVPCAIISWRFVFGRRADLDPFLAGVVLYVFGACISGGWSFTALFLLGAFLGLSIDVRRSARRAVALIAINEVPRVQLQR
jgi:hypothetical protein